MNKYEYLRRVVTVLFIFLMTQIATRTAVWVMIEFYEYSRHTPISKISLQNGFQSIVILLILFSLLTTVFTKILFKSNVAFSVIFVCAMYIIPVALLSYIAAPASFITIFICTIVIDALLQMLSKRLERRTEESAARKEKKLRRMKEPLFI